MEHNISTLAGKLEGDLMSDACIGTGDQRFLTLQPEFLRHRGPSNGMRNWCGLETSVWTQPVSHGTTITLPGCCGAIQVWQRTLYFWSAKIVNNNVDYA